MIVFYVSLCFLLNLLVSVTSILQRKFYITEQHFCVGGTRIMPLLTLNFKLDNPATYFLSVKLWLVVTVFKRTWSVS